MSKNSNFTFPQHDSYGCMCPRCEGPKQAHHAQCDRCFNDPMVDGLPWYMHDNASVWGDLKKRKQGGEKMKSNRDRDAIDVGVALLIMAAVIVWLLLMPGEW